MAEEQQKPKQRQRKGRARDKSYMTGLTESQMKLYDTFFWLPPIDLQDPEAKELLDRTEQYRKACMELNIIPTLSDYAFVVGHKRDNLLKYRDGERKCSRKTRDILFAVSRWMEAALSQVGFNNPLLGTYTIWLQKNYFGFRDSVDININNQLTDGQSAQDVMARYKFIEASVITPEIEQKDQADIIIDAADVVEVEEQH